MQMKAIAPKVLSLLTLGFAVSGHSDIIDDLKPGSWIELPCKNKIEGVLPKPLPEGNSGPMSVVEKWSSGAYDSKRDRLVVWGGGHQDYQGNELYAFDLKTLTWERLTDPTATPTAVHTYDALEYLPKEDRFWAQGGSRWPSGSGTNATWTFDFTSKKWESKKDHPDGWGLGNVTAYDPMTGNVIWDGDGNSWNRMQTYNATTNVWTQRGSSNFGNYEQTAALDVKRRKFVRVGAGEINVYDMSQSGSLSPVKVTTTGSTDLVAKSYPGIEYDPVSENLLAWAGGQAVYELNIETKKWTVTQGAGANPGSTADRGTFNRWRYVPSRNIFIIVNGIDKNVFAYRHTAGLKAPTWYTNLMTGTTGLNKAPNPVKAGSRFSKVLFSDYQIVYGAISPVRSLDKGSVYEGKDARGRSVRLRYGME
jgi:hypothetical protein